MSLTVKEWESYFVSLSQAQRDTLHTAIVILEDDSEFKKHFDDTGLFALKHSIQIADTKVQNKKKEANIGNQNPT